MSVLYRPHSKRCEIDEHQAILSAVCKTAWAEHPGLAIQLNTRFQSQKLANDVRLLLLNYPEKAIGEPDALQILLGDTMPTDVSFQLKVSFADTIKFDAYFTVSTLLGSSKSDNSCDILPTRIR